MFHQSVLALIATWEGHNWLKNVAAQILLASALQNILYKNQQEYGFSFPMNIFFLSGATSTPSSVNGTRDSLIKGEMPLTLHEDFMKC